MWRAFHAVSSIAEAALSTTYREIEGRIGAFRNELASDNETSGAGS